jgi:hypothetical protein
MAIAAGEMRTAMADFTVGVWGEFGGALFWQPATFTRNKPVNKTSTAKSAEGISRTKR